MLFPSLVLVSSDSEGDDSSYESESDGDPMPGLAHGIPASPPGLDEIPVLQEAREDDEFTEDMESGIDPKTTEIIDIIYDAQDKEGTRLEKSEWVRGQFDQLMAKDRQDNPERTESESQEQHNRYTHIMLDRLENSGGDLYAARHWKDLDSRAVSVSSDTSENRDEGETSQVPMESLEQINTEQGTKRSLSPDSDAESSNKRQKTDRQESLLDEFANTSSEMPTYIDED